MSKTLFVFLLFMSVTIIAGWSVIQILPAHYHPLAALDVRHPTTFVTKFKVRRLRDDPQACLAALETAQVDFELIPDRETGDGCGFHNAVHLRKSIISYGGNITLSCPALVALTLWERHHLMPLANEIFQQPVVRVNHYGTYACRNVNNAQSGRRSQHATANAIDVAGFVLEDGQQITVKQDWDSSDKKGQFLTALRDGGCKYFSTVLGPDYNQLHADHFHFDMGGGFICR